MRVPFDLHHPVWVEDPDFDIIHHVRRVSCPAPGGPKELAAICARITSTPLDRSRPLWEVWVIEGLADGRFAFLTKVHHCAVDGASGAELMVHLFSTERDAPPFLPPVRPASPEPLPTEMELVRDAVTSRLRQPMEMLRLARHTVETFAGIVRRRRDPDSVVGATPLTAPRTRFNGAITAQRSIAFARVPLAPVKAIRKAFGVTVNDVVLAICAGTLRRYLDRHGELPPESLVAVCPISVRDGRKPARSANRVSAMFTSLATDLADPIARLRAIQNVTRGAKEEHNAVGARHAPELGGVRRPDRVLARRPRLRADEARRSPQARAQPRHLERARPAVPALPRGRGARRAPTRWAPSSRGPGST